MNARIEKLEAGHAAILAKLDGITTSIAEGRLENEKRFGGFDVSLTKLEERSVNTVTTAALTSGLGDLNGKVEKVDGRISNIPTTWQTIAIIVGMLVGIGGVSFTIAKLAESARQTAAVAPLPPPATVPSAPPGKAP